jgi:hypothetical protein
VSTEHSEGESLYYIISPKDIVVAKERDQDDHIDWLLDKKKYEVGVIIVQSSRLHVGTSYFAAIYHLCSVLMHYNCRLLPKRIFSLTGSSDGCRDKLQEH